MTLGKGWPDGQPLKKTVPKAKKKKDYEWCPNCRGLGYFSTSDKKENLLMQKIMKRKREGFKP